MTSNCFWPMDSVLTSPTAIKVAARGAWLMIAISPTHSPGLDRRASSTVPWSLLNRTRTSPETMM
jgi:hypothetical protein